MHNRDINNNENHNDVNIDGIDASLLSPLSDSFSGMLLPGCLCSVLVLSILVQM